MRARVSGLLFVPGQHNRYPLQAIMPSIVLTTEIDAPIETVFDLSRSIDLHIDSTSATNERAIAGVTSGLIKLGESVTWEATHFFIRQQLTVRIGQFDRPNHFRDSMVSGAFSRFDHDHNFETVDSRTIMTDTFDFTSPLGILGNIADWLFVTRHMRKLLETRNCLIKSVAESGDFGEFV
jgi:ligand-binding SRPBCC domain-containing protein